MNEPICHLEQQYDRLAFVEQNIEGIAEYPITWDWKDEVSYRLNNYTGDTLPRWQTRAVTVALRAWKLRIKNIWFRRERNPNAHVDFDISFEPGDHFSSAGVLAHAFFPSGNDSAGDCHINDAWDWVPSSNFQTLAKPPLVPILIHEFGHSLGLRHDTAASSQNVEIMYPNFNLGRKMASLGPRTIQRIQDRYGVRTLSQRILDYFLARRLRGSDFR